MSKRKKRNENKGNSEQKQLSITDKAREEWLESKKEEEEEEQQIIITDGEVEEEVGDIEYPEEDEDEEEVKEVEETTKENKREDKKDTKKDTKKGAKKDTKKDTKSSSNKPTGPRPVIIYGKEIYIEEDTTLSLEQIRAKLVDEYKFNEFADKTQVVMNYDPKTGEVRPMIELKKKG